MDLSDLSIRFFFIKMNVKQLIRMTDVSENPLLMLRIIVHVYIFRLQMK